MQWRLLLLGGDVEANPGPLTKAQEEKLNLVFSTVQRLEASNATVLEAVNKVLLIHIDIKNDLDALTKRVSELETKPVVAASTVTGVSHDANFACMQEKLDDLENRSRRSNVLFFGITDTDPSETWESSETHVHEFCSNKLGVTVTSIARAHRLGRFSPDKMRPIIAKFYNEKEVETVLSKGVKLKNTTFSISRDFSEAVREKRRRLLQFSRTIKKEGDRVRLVFNKLMVNDTTYTWDAAANRVICLSQPVTPEANASPVPEVVP